MKLVLLERKVGAIKSRDEYTKQFEQIYGKYLDYSRKYDFKLAEIEWFMARFCRAMMMYDEAMKHADCAIEIDISFAPALSEKILLLAHEYHRRFERALDMAYYKRVSDAKNPDSLKHLTFEGVERQDASLPRARAQMSETYEMLVQRHPTISDLEYLRLVVDATMEMAKNNNELSQARVEKLEKAVRAFPQREEAVHILAKALNEDRKKCLEILTIAVENDKGYPGNYLLRGNVYLDMGTLQCLAGEKFDESYEKAAADLEFATTLDPGLVEGWFKLGIVYMCFGDRIAGTDRDPVPHYEKAELAFEKACDLGHGDYHSHLWFGALESNFGLYLSGMGKDPTKQFDRGAEALENAVKFSGQDYEARVFLGGICVNKGLYLEAKGQDGLELFMEGEKHLTHALKAHSADERPWLLRGVARLDIASTLMERNQDCLQWLENSERDLTESIKRDEVDYEPWLRRGQARLNIGVYKFNRNLDGSQQLADAEQDFTESIKRDSRYYEPFLRRGITRCAIARTSLALKKGSRDRLAAIVKDARADLEHAIRINSQAKTEAQNVLPDLEEVARALEQDW